MKRPAILLVDDDQNILHLFQMFLREEGYTVETASTQEEALSMVKAAKFDLVILDLILEETRGDWLALELDEIDEDLRFLFLTGFSSPNINLEALPIDICAVLTKPISLEDLGASVLEALPRESEN
jgi:DNA-binding NtrC family response regulator